MSLLNELFTATRYPCAHHANNIELFLLGEYRLRIFASSGNLTDVHNIGIIWNYCMSKRITEFNSINFLSAIIGQ